MSSACFMQPVGVAALTEDHHPDPETGEGTSACISFRLSGVLGDVPMPALRERIERRDNTVIVKTMAPTAVVAELAAWAHAYGVEELPELSISRGHSQGDVP